MSSLRRSAAAAPLGFASRARMSSGSLRSALRSPSRTLRFSLAVAGLVLAALAGPAPAGEAAPPIRWNETRTPHFDVYYESQWLPKGLVFFLEGVHRRLEMELGHFSPWMKAHKIRFYLHKDHKSFLAGDYKPPSWSQGFAVQADRALVMYEMADQELFRRIAAHELTHLFFGSYFDEKKRAPPQWLNEGLAMLMEANGNPGAQKDGWWEASRFMPREKVLPAEEFAATKPKAQGSAEEVNIWYLQAYLMTRFLFREHSKFLFQSFCSTLREGEKLGWTLRKVYGFSTPKKMDEAWTAYAKLPALPPKDGMNIGRKRWTPIEFMTTLSTPTFKTRRSTETAKEQGPEPRKAPARP